MNITKIIKSIHISEFMQIGLGLIVFFILMILYSFVVNDIKTPKFKMNNLEYYEITLDNKIDY